MTMIKEIKEKFPIWCGDTETKFELMMSDDLDALMCYQMQKYNYGRECEYFINSSSKKACLSYDRTTKRDGEQYFYGTSSASGYNKNILCLDFSIDINTKSWDNHVSKISSIDEYNTLSANMNLIDGVACYNYRNKYCISSFITMLSYYDIHIEKWTHEQLICLCAIDGLYQPFKNSRFKETGSRNIKNLGYDLLIDFIEKYIDEIEKFYNKYVKNKNIWVTSDGSLATNLDLKYLSDIFGIDIALPTKQFKLISKIESTIITTSQFNNKKAIERHYGKKIFNIAMTYSNSGVVSFINK